MKENETKKFDQIVYNNAYNKKTYKNIALRCKPSEYEQIENFCQNMDISKNQLLIRSALYIINNDLFSEIAQEK